MKGRELVKKEASAKGRNALISGAVTATAAYFLSPWLLILGVPVTLVLAYQWFKYRAINGLKF